MLKSEDLKPTNDDTSSFSPGASRNIMIRHRSALKAGKHQEKVTVHFQKAEPSRLSTTKQRISMLLILAACAAFLQYHFTVSIKNDAAVVDLGYAKYLGNQTTTWPNVVSYLGLPYAEPPVGNQRFRSPLPLNMTRVADEAMGQIIDARSYPEFCIQGKLGRGDHGGAGSEDCLKVNVYNPVGVKSNAKLPVLVYIHGGGYVFGNPANWPFEHWIQQSPNVVIVSVYYRLDSLGFLATPEFADGSVGDLNAGFWDQIEALRWVQKHIGKFGGDPTKVTINGESAGGSSIELHLVARSGKEKLFRGAIAQSVFRAPLPTPQQQEPLFSALATQVGCRSANVTDTMACLRSASISALAIAQDNVTEALSGYHAFRPVIDKKVFVDFPTRLIANGAFKNVPLIVGATSNETLANGADIASAARSFFPSLTDDGVQAIEEAYPISSFASEELRQETATGDISVRCARSILASAWDAAHVDVWTYRYNQPDGTSHSPAAAHAAENYMMFRGTHTGVNGTTTFFALNPSEITFSEELIAYWLSFVRELDPNSHKLARSPIWAQYTSEKRNRIVLNAASDRSNVIKTSGSHVELGDDELERCKVAASLVEQMQN